MRKRVFLLVLCVIAALVLCVSISQVNTPVTIVGPVALVLRDITPLSVGPDPSFFVGHYLYSGRRYPIIGRDTSGAWWQLDVDGTPGWVAASAVSEANVENVPVIKTTPCVNDMSTTCPVIRSTTVVTMQTFENGMMFLRNDEHWIYLLFNDGRFEGYRDDWNGQTLTQETPPKGLQQPSASLGYMWLNHPGLRARLGWATADTVTYTTTLEISDGTLYAPSDDVTYIRLPDRRAVSISWYHGRWSFSKR